MKTVLLSEQSFCPGFSLAQVNLKHFFNKTINIKINSIIKELIYLTGEYNDGVP